MVKEKTDISDAFTCSGEAARIIRPEIFAESWGERVPPNVSALQVHHRVRRIGGIEAPLFFEGLNLRGNVGP